MVIIGDININILPNDTNTITNKNADSYLNMAASHGLLPAHTFPTRGENCLDHILLKSDKQAVSLVIDSLITDHIPIILMLESKTIPLKATYTSKRVDIAACVTDIEKTDFSSVLNSTNAENATSLLVNLTSCIVATHTKTVIISCRKRTRKPWMTPGLLRCIRHRDKLSKKLKENGDKELHKAIYIRYKNFCNNLLKRIKCDYERTEFQKHSKNAKGTWKLIKEITHTGKCTTSTDDLLRIEEDPVCSVNKVNNFFVNVGNELASKINSEPNFPVTLTINPAHVSANGSLDSMVILPTDCDEIESTLLILKPNCAVGWDGISSALIKAACVCRYSCVSSPIMSRFQFMSDNRMRSQGLEESYCTSDP